MSNLCILGDILVDYTITSANEDDKMRLGGIFHAARASWALDANYELVYFAPAFLDGQIENLTKIHQGSTFKLGDIVGAPNVILIKEAKETGDQGYELLLRDARKYSINEKEFLQRIVENIYTEILIFSGGFDLKKILTYFKSNQIPVSIDISNDIKALSEIEYLGRKFKYIFISTSSTFFLNTFNKSFSELKDALSKYCEIIVFKENRGGSRCVDVEKNIIHSIPSQTRKIVHSVGVGDAYDIAAIVKYNPDNISDSLHFASWLAMEYASTTYPDDFKLSVSRLEKISIQELKSFKGVSLPWEQRDQINIYIAAPDFDYVDREIINKVGNILTYHNFRPRYPIRENGQLSTTSTATERENACNNDMELLYKCQMVIAVLLFNDPGTLIEIGVAIAAGIPTVVYDPNNIAQNCILSKLPDLVSNDLDEVIAKVYLIANDL